MSCVFPGRPDVLAKFFRSINILIKEDLPTFDLPIKAYSGKGSFGHLVTSVLLITKSADFMFIESILEVTLFEPGVKNGVEFFGMLHHGCMAAFFNPEQCGIG